MTSGMLVRVPVSGAFGTDDDFDLRARLEHDLGEALAAAGLGECGLGEIDAGFMTISLEGVPDSDAAFRLVHRALGRHDLLDRATVLLQTPCDDPDDTDVRVLWPLSDAAVRVA